VLSLHKSFDIFVLSSTTEGLGTSLLDAMACSKPIVAAKAGGIPEVVDDGVTGLLVPPKDHQALAHAIVTLLKDARLRQEYGAAGFARVRDRYSAERMVQDTLKVYERVASSRRPPASSSSAGW
jgi:glycosyltransferase involved in cell wall biosynthesis